MSNSWKSSLQSAKHGIYSLLHGRYSPVSSLTILPRYHGSSNRRTLTPLWPPPSRNLVTQTDTEDKDCQNRYTSDNVWASVDDGDFEYLEESISSNKGHAKGKALDARKHEKGSDDRIDNNDEDYLDNNVDDNSDDGGGFCDSDELQSGSVSSRQRMVLEKVLDNKEWPLWKRLEQSMRKRSGTVEDAVEGWLKDGNPINRSVIATNITILRRQHKYRQAIKLSDWLMAEKPYELSEMDFAIRIELISKGFGVQKAVEYFQTIPKKYQRSMAYSILLNNYISFKMEKEALETVKKAEWLGLSDLTYMYNQLLILYKGFRSMKGVSNVLNAMDKKEIKPDVDTYNIILDFRASEGDVQGMEHVFSKMQDDKSIVPDAVTFLTLAKGYLMEDLTDKAVNAIKRAEDSSCRKQRMTKCLALKLYGRLGKEREVERMWKSMVESDSPRLGDYVAMIEAIGQAAGYNRAEEIFEEMAAKIGVKKILQYNILLSVYVAEGEIQRAERLMKKIEEGPLRPNALTYNYLVLMYLNMGDGMKAMEALKDAQSAVKVLHRDRPMYASLKAMLEFAAEKGDVKKAELVFKDIKNMGYARTCHLYSILLQAYRKAGRIPYGITERVNIDGSYLDVNSRMLLEELNGT